jgi:hypothetical protein
MTPEEIAIKYAELITIRNFIRRCQGYGEQFQKDPDCVMATVLDAMENCAQPPRRKWSEKVNGHGR